MCLLCRSHSESPLGLAVPAFCKKSIQTNKEDGYALVKEFVHVGLSCDERWFSSMRGILLACSRIVSFLVSLC